MKKICFAISVIMLVGYGCRPKKQDPVSFYVIEIPSEDIIDNDKKFKTIDKYCEISSVDIFPAFASQRIALRGKSHQIEYFRNHKWATLPSEKFTSFIVYFFEKHQIFKGVDKRFRNFEPEYVIETRIFQLEVIENDNGLIAHINFELRLIENESGNILIKHGNKKYSSLEENTINDFSSAISEMFYKELIIFSNKIMSLTEAE